jgi:hypothetical protein
MTPEEKRAMLDPLDVRVTITAWTTCETCEGRGKRKGGRGGVAYPTCRAMRRVPQLRIVGMVLDRLEVGEAEWVAPSDAISVRLEVAGG